MPWETIVKDLEGKLRHKDFRFLPRDDECLAYLLSIHLKVAGRDFHEHLKQVHLRPFVLVLLLHELINKGYPVFRDSLPAHLLKEEVEKQVYKIYPETENETLPEKK